VTDQPATAQNAPTAPLVIAPGNYDGVHLGHRALIRRARDFGTVHKLATAVLTFDPHPSAFLGATDKPMITGHARRSELIKAAGADYVFVQPFTHEFAALSPEAFVEALLARGARAMVVGPDFRFGAARVGDCTRLGQLAQARGFTLMIEPPVKLDTERVSSSAVRTALATGDVCRAAQFLGRVHEIQGLVVEGFRRGRTLGFPTANIALSPVMPPRDGVYAVFARELGTDDRPLLRGVANLGLRPTFEAGRSMEVHLFDFNRDIYGRELRIGFVDRIRGEQRFSGLDELRKQITRDCERAHELLARAPSTWTELL